jgi:hypothetical protein
VVLGLSLRACFSADDAKAPAPHPRASATPTAPPRINVVSAAYVGKGATSVRTTLLGLGLAPVLVYDGRGTPAGTVSSVTPTGPLAHGAAVTVHVVPTPAPAPRERKHGKGKHD